MLLTNAFDPDPRVHREATALLQSGYCVTIIGWDRDATAKPVEEIDGIHIERICVPSKHARGMGQLFFLLRFWYKALFRSLRKEFAVVHAHDFDTLLLGYLLARLKRARLVYDAHESYVDMMHQLPAFFRRLIYMTESWLLRRANLVITVGELLRDHLSMRGAKRAVVVGNWQDPLQFKFDAGALAAVRNQLGISDGKAAVCFIANLGRERQLPPLLDAMRRSPHIHLILGGNGPCRDIAEAAARECNNISYLGPVPSDQIPLFTAASDAVFYGFDPKNPNSRFSAPNKLFEALGAGKMIMTADFGEIGRIVTTERCGVILRDYSVEAITEAFRILGTPESERMGEAARQLGLLKYNWEVARNMLVEQYDQLL
jgi:glycosyltransferase involved in cell wall biosynthesis